MATKHLYNETEGLVVKALRGIISYNPSLSLIEDEKVVYDTTHSPSNVSIICGGGAGHEPGWAGYVGTNMLAAGVMGDVFASPRRESVVCAIDRVSSDEGVILVVANYTGDRLHWGLACEKVNARKGSPCGMIITGDDVSISTKDNLVGRRGLAGQILILKFLGAAAGAGASFDDCMSLGTAVTDQCVSIAMRLDHCHVPGSAERIMLQENEIEVGIGPHNEPGQRKVSPIPSAEDLVSILLGYLLDSSDQDRVHLPFAPGDNIVLMINNLGGISCLELNALVDEHLSQLEKQYAIRPCRIYTGLLETSLNAPAFSTTLLNLTAATKHTRFSISQMQGFLDARTSTQWESAAGKQDIQKSPTTESKIFKTRTIRNVDPNEDLIIDSTLLEAIARNASSNLIAAEPNLTKWDTIMGDGDCGQTCTLFAKAMLSALDNGIAKTGSVVLLLYEIESIIDNRMGGTLGGIFGIFFVSLTTHIRHNVGSVSGIQLWAKALAGALHSLQYYTPAKVGDRTMMDTLIPFVNGMETGSFEKAADEAIRAAEGTKALVPRLGRATYIGEMQGKEMPPDPGAMAVAEVLRGLRDGLH